MFSTNIFRVAFVTIGSALSLGSGIALATVQQLDGTGTHAAVPVIYAQELLTSGSPRELKSVPIKSPANHGAHKLVVSPNRAIGGNEFPYLRLSLGGGMVFSGPASGIKWSVGVRPAGMATCTYDADTTDERQGQEEVTYRAAYSPDGVELETIHSSGGSPGDDYVVFRLDLLGGNALDLDGNAATGAESRIPMKMPMFDSNEADPPDVNENDDPADDIADNNDSESCDIPASKVMLWADVLDHLAIPAGSGAYSASISLHADPDDAPSGRRGILCIDRSGHYRKGCRWS